MSLSDAEIYQKITTANKNVANKDAVNDDFALVFGSDFNWEELLAPAPIGIAILGDLMCFASTMRDFGIDDKPPINGFQHIKRPNSFKATLVQVSNSGYSAFMSAHINMDKIRLYTLNVPNYMKNATKYLLTKNPEAIKAFLPNELENINEVASKCVDLSEQIVIDFDQLIGLIQEVIEACEATKGHKEQEYYSKEEDLKILELKEQSSKEAVERSKKDKENIEKMIDEANEAVKKATRDMPTMAEIVGWNMLDNLVNMVTSITSTVVNSQLPGARLTAAASTVTGLFKEFKPLFSSNNTSSSSSNPGMMTSDHIGDIQMILSKNAKYVQAIHAEAVALHDVCKREELNSATKGKFNSEYYRNRLLTAESEAKGSGCDPILKLYKDGLGIVDDLRNISNDGNGNVTLSVKEKASTFLKDADAMYQMTLSQMQPIPNRTPNEPVKNTSSPSGGSAVQLAVNNAKSTLQMATDRLANAQDIGMQKTLLMEQAIKDQLDVLVQMQKVKFEKINYEDALKLLHYGMDKLRELKASWYQLVIFFKKIANVIDIVMKKSLEEFNKNVLTVSNNIVFLDMQLDTIYSCTMKASQTSYLVYCMANMYGKVSSRYIMDRLARLDMLLAIDPKETQAVERARQELAKFCKEAAEGIMKLVKDDRNDQNKKIEARKLQIEKEYSFLKALPASTDEDEF